MNDQEGVKQKKARIRVPREKINELAGVDLWPSYKVKGKGTIQVYEDDKAFMSNEVVIFIEGDHHLVEPMIRIIMTILEGKEVTDGTHATSEEGDGTTLQWKDPLGFSRYWENGHRPWILYEEGGTETNLRDNDSKKEGSP